MYLVLKCSCLNIFYWHYDKITDEENVFTAVKIKNNLFIFYNYLYNSYFWSSNLIGWEPFPGVWYSSDNGTHFGIHFTVCITPFAAFLTESVMECSFFFFFWWECSCLHPRAYGWITAMLIYRYIALPLMWYYCSCKIKIYLYLALHLSNCSLKHFKPINDLYERHQHTFCL